MALRLCINCGIHNLFQLHTGVLTFLPELTVVVSSCPLVFSQNYELLNFFHFVKFPIYAYSSYSFLVRGFYLTWILYIHHRWTYYQYFYFLQFFMGALYVSNRHSKYTSYKSLFASPVLGRCFSVVLCYSWNIIVIDMIGLKKVDDFCCTCFRLKQN